MLKVISLLLFLFSTMVQASPLDIIPVQHDGRIKPFKGYAAESLQFIYGRAKYNKKPATEIIMTWMLAPEEWDNIKFVRVQDKEIRESLKIDSNETLYSPKDLVGNEVFKLRLQEIATKSDNKEPLTSLEDKLVQLDQKIALYFGLRSGQLFNIYPQTMGFVPTDNNEKWINAYNLKGDGLAGFKKLVTAFSGYVSGSKEKDLKAAVNDWIGLVKNKDNHDLIPWKQINAELKLLNHKPFLWSWILYLLAAIFCLVLFLSDKKKTGLKKTTYATIGLALALHIYGLLLRVYVTGRAPVTNMYETVVWVALVAVVFSLVFQMIKTRWLTLLSACFTAAFCLILTHLSPVVLDPKLSPLEPVLRDNFWLLTHVLIIVGSYAAFFVAFVLGDIMLATYLLKPKAYEKMAKDAAMSIYRCLQLGVVTLTAGTILGAIWADYSWGRFWAWDPKETWALIGILGYLALLHARLTGWAKDFGMAVGSVLAFSLIIMAWYGVNFVLGAGLHSYGFGAGGFGFVATFVAIHWVFVALVVWKKQAS